MQQDYQEWNKMLGAAPPEQSGRAVYDSIRQMLPQQAAAVAQWAQQNQPQAFGYTAASAVASLGAASLANRARER